LAWQGVNEGCDVALKTRLHPMFAENSLELFGETIVVWEYPEFLLKVCSGHFCFDFRLRVFSISLSQMFNSRTCQLVLGAGALQLVGLKTITAKHLGIYNQ